WAKMSNSRLTKPSTKCLTRTPQREQDHESEIDGGPRENSKHQAPNTREASKLKLQLSAGAGRIETWVSGFPSSLLLGNWNFPNGASKGRAIQTSRGRRRLFPLPIGWSIPTSRAGGHRGRFVCTGRLVLSCPEGTIENSPAFQRWVGRQKVARPEGTAEVQSHTPSFSRPFGTSVPCRMFPGVKTPGYSQAVPPGQRNLAAAFSAKRATRFTTDVCKAISRARCPARKMWDTFSPKGEGQGEGKGRDRHALARRHGAGPTQCTGKGAAGEREAKNRSLFRARYDRVDDRPHRRRQTKDLVHRQRNHQRQTDAGHPDGPHRISRYPM